MKEVSMSYGSADLLKAASYFHGHTGPFLVLGLKAGELSNRMLGRDPFKTRVEVRSNPKPPQSCMVDGIQFSTGCTMGKGNISLIPSDDGISVVFSCPKGVLELKPQPWVLAGLQSLDHDAVEHLADELYSKTAESIFYFELRRA